MLTASPAVRGGWVTARDLVGGLLIGVGLGVAIDASGAALPLAVRRTAQVFVAIGLLALAGTWWGRHMAHLAGAPDTRRVGRATGLAFGPGVVVVGAVLGMIEPALVGRGARSGLAIHDVYTLLFVPSTFLIVAAGCFALGLGLRGARFGAWLALRTGIAAMLTFLVISRLMDTLGWRVGGPNAGARATMVVVTLISMIGTAVVAGAVIGTSLQQKRVAQAV
jgi:hypothetical protein